jgi:hypothetical protein
MVLDPPVRPGGRNGFSFAPGINGVVGFGKSTLLRLLKVPV